VQRLLSKTNGKVVGDLMTPAPVVVRETTNLEDAARYCQPFFFCLFSWCLFGIVVAVAVQSVFRLEIHQNDVFFFIF
jgi:hypothetical protein